ncbi:MAG TPA: hypothetical protein VIL65_15865 [Beijerinckiaceae bacterium]
MSAETSTAAPAGSRRLGVVLLIGSVVALVAAGALLWSRHGAAVFSDMVVAAIAWCF